MRKELISKSKFLSLVLRHKPEEIGIRLDEAGWVDVDELLRACLHHGNSITRAQLEEVVATNEKKRFTFSDDGRRIRAHQGHSIEVELGYEPAMPPETLYHGTATRFIESIWQEGLLRGGRHDVHLSETPESASAVGQRHGRLAMLIVRSGDMHRAGHVFHRTPNHVWLTQRVPVEFIEFPSGS